MNPAQIKLLFGFAAFLVFIYFWPRREAIAHNLYRTLVAFTCMAVAFVLLWKLGLPPLAAYITALVIGILIRRAEPPRSRRIKARVKRQAIAKWEKESGETFNRRVHELDHKLAHSRGGGNTEDNIQVLTKKKNRSKGAKLGWRDKG
jgi:hypothetical protein